MTDPASWADVDASARYWLLTRARGDADVELSIASGGESMSLRDVANALESNAIMLVVQRAETAARVAMDAELARLQSAFGESLVEWEERRAVRYERARELSAIGAAFFEVGRRVPVPFEQSNCFCVRSFHMPDYRIRHTVDALCPACGGAGHGPGRSIVLTNGFPHAWSVGVHEIVGCHVGHFLARAGDFGVCDVGRVLGAPRAKGESMQAHLVRIMRAIWQTESEAA